MSWLLFLDESGHDHKQIPYEVRGGIAACGHLHTLPCVPHRLIQFHGQGYRDENDFENSGIF